MNMKELKRKEGSDDVNFQKRYAPLYIHRYSGDLVHSCKVNVGWPIKEAGSPSPPNNSTAILIS
jgi:hypothetical protein